MTKTISAEELLCAFVVESIKACKFVPEPDNLNSVSYFFIIYIPNLKFLKKMYLILKRRLFFYYDVMFLLISVCVLSFLFPFFQRNRQRLLVLRLKKINIKNSNKALNWYSIRVFVYLVNKVQPFLL